MRILVTGAGGYLGTGVAKQLCEDGNEVIASCRKPSDDIDGRCKVIVGDIMRLKNPFHELGEPDVLLHMAWEKGFVHNDVSHINNIPLHYRFLEKMIMGGVKRVAVMGTMHEIGFFEGSIKEDTPANPRSLYGIAKNALRNATVIMCEKAGIPYQWLRGYYIVGNVDNGCSVFSKIAEAEESGQKLFPFTSGINQWDFLDYDQFCTMTAKAVEQDTIKGIINICSGRPERLSDRVEQFINDNHYKIKLDYCKYPDRPYDSKAVWGDDSKIMKIMKNAGY